MSSKRTFAGLILLTISLFFFPDTVAQQGQWLTLQGDHKRTGRTGIKGQIDTPELLWELDLAAREIFFAIDGQQSTTKNYQFQLDRVPEWKSSIGREWGTESELELAHPLEVRGDFLEDVPGFETVRFTDYWTGEGEADLQLISSRGIEWSVNFVPKAERPMVIVEDIDGDGQLEIAVSHWHGVTVYNLNNGEVKYRNNYRSNERARQYGHFSSVKLPDGEIALIVAGDFAPHIGVLKVNNTYVNKDDWTLDVLWYKKLDLNATQGGIQGRETINLIVPRPAGDFDGDGRMEIMMNYFNGKGDSRWYLMGYDLLTGKVKYEIKDFFLDGSVDADGDGRREWLGRFTTGRVVNEISPLGVLKPGGNNPAREIWSIPQGRWSMYPVLTSPYLRISGNSVMKPVTHPGGNEKGEVLFYSAPDENGNSEILSALSLDNGKEILWSITGPVSGKLNAVSSKNNRVLVGLMQSQAGETELKSEGATVDLIAKKRSEGVYPQPLIIKDKDGVSHVITATSAGYISAFSTGKNNKPELVWSYPGRPMATSKTNLYGLEAGDINNDGVPEIFYVTKAPEGGARIIARSLRGEEIWHYDFPDFSGYLANWNESMTTFWTLGNFLSNESLDLLVSNRRSIMHTDESVVIDIESSEIAWHKKTLWVTEPWTSTSWQHTRGYGGGMPALADFNGDGQDDIALGYPSEVSVISGKNGEQLYVESTGPVPDTDNIWLGGGEIMVTDFNQDNSPQILKTHPDMLVMFEHDKKRSSIAWKTDVGVGMFHREQFGTLINNRGNGGLEFVYINSDGNVVAINPVTGGREWLLPGADNAKSNLISADINNNGYKEIIFGSGGKIVAVSGHNIPEILWTFNTGDSDIVNLVIADVNGDGFAEILASGRNGKIYCIGNKFNFHYDDNSEPKETPGVLDIDGNLYRTVIIGDQEWFAENLKTTRYSNGGFIPGGLNDGNWSRTKSGAYAVYPFEYIENLRSVAEVLATYGALYNWYAVADSRGLCPADWRIPADRDWAELTDYLIHNNEHITSGNVGNTLKSIRQVDFPAGRDEAVMEHPRWNFYEMHDLTDEFGFSALPAGFRLYNGPYGGIGFFVYWWSSTESDSNINTAWARFLSFAYGNLLRYYWGYKHYGFPVRCIRTCRQ